MVTITNIAVRQSKDGRAFTTLELSGGLEMAQSQETGKFYATVRKCSVPTTFDESVAKTLIGSSLEGNIVRTEALPYDYTNPDTGEVMCKIRLNCPPLRYFKLTPLKTISKRS